MKAFKFDDEGSELSLLEGARQTIESFRPKLLVATHSPELHLDCKGFLQDLDYEVIEPKRAIQALCDGWHTVALEPELLCFDPQDTPNPLLISDFQRS